MKRFYIEIENNIIKNPAYISGENIEEIEITEPFLEVAEEFYLQHKDLLPATFELDDEGNMINITSLPKHEPEPARQELTTEEYLIDLDYRISMIELGL